MERGKPGAQSQLQAMKRRAGNQIGITVLYPGESGATTDKLPDGGTGTSLQQHENNTHDNQGFW